MIADLLVLPRCARCGGERWICETHPNVVWPHGGCSEPRIPCPACNAGEPPRKPRGGVSWVRVAEE
jgi:hypothetical protein